MYELLQCSLLSKEKDSILFIFAFPTNICQLYVVFLRKGSEKLPVGFESQASCLLVRSPHVTSGTLPSCSSSGSLSVLNKTDCGTQEQQQPVQKGSPARAAEQDAISTAAATLHYPRMGSVLLYRHQHTTDSLI